ncbi:AfsR/SARP family transcriptional regulator, partial [Streptomyces sp. 15-116A]|uniref:AfsR/SARP family transcriptional regulator n=1 Tax=Streptomyces sp. 15-116A TaxID=2259035 RepID=UPI0021B32416
MNRGGTTPGEEAPPSGAVHAGGTAPGEKPPGEEARPGRAVDAGGTAPGEKPPSGAVNRGGTAPGKKPPGEEAPPGAAAVAVEFRLLGPVGVLDGRTGRPLRPAGERQRVLLCALLAHAGSPVRPADLIGELWGGTPPDDPAGALHAQVSRLRRLLRTTGGRQRISTGPAGYRLDLDEATVDAHRFTRLADEALLLLTHDPGRGSALLREALALWRGPALQDSRGGPLCAAEARRLDALRLTALESLYATELSRDRHAEVTGELERLTRVHPLHEPFYDQLMLALSRAGRRAEALAVYRR